MKILKWMTWLHWLGVVASIMVVLWWALVFYFVGQQTGEPMLANLSCLFAPTTDCNMLRGMAWLRGINPYEPFAFWWAISVTALAWTAKRALQE